MARLPDTEERFRTSIDSMLDAVAIMSAVRDRRGEIVDFTYEHVNPSLCGLVGLPAEELVGARLLERFPAHRESGLFERYRRVVETGEPLIIEDLRYEDEVGQRHLALALDLRAVKLGDGYVVAGRDITEQLRAQEALRASEARFRGAVDTMLDAFGIYSAVRDESGEIVDFRVEYVNDAACEAATLTREEQLGRRVRELFPDYRDDLFAAHRHVVETGEPSVLEDVSWKGAVGDGHELETAFDIRAVRLGDGYAVTWRDISARKRAEAELRFQADHDALTGLFNRRRLHDELTRAVAAAARYGEPAGLLVLDVDEFKVINDALGHKAGDEFIIHVAGVLRARLRDTDVLARLGGDEFAVILPHTGLHGTRRVAESLRRAVPDHPTVLGGRRVRGTLSIGATVLGDADVDAEDALAVADVAMFEAKRHGRDQVVAHTVAEHRHDAGEILGWTERLRDALAHGHFELYAQPILDLATDRVTRHELLLRLHEDNHVALPGSFIPTAERYGLIRELDQWVVRDALRLLAEDRDGRDVYEVNLSGASIGDPNLLALIEDGVRHEAVDPSRLIFEITETAAIADLPAAEDFTRRLSHAGCASALDDFGSGFGSFSYLRRLPVDELKIDGEFVRRLPSSRDDRLLVQAIVDVARGLGKRTVAEYVTSAAVLEQLRDMGVDYVQGHHVGRPAPLLRDGGGRRPRAAATGR